MIIDEYQKRAKKKVTDLIYIVFIINIFFFTLMRRKPEGDDHRLLPFLFHLCSSLFLVIDEALILMRIRLLKTPSSFDLPFFRCKLKYRAPTAWGWTLM